MNQQMKPTKRMSKDERMAIIAKKENLFDLYEACMNNAGKFIDEARILFQHKAYSRAAFLAYCALEETGKAQIVADFYNGDLSEDEFRKSYRHHETKAAYTRRKVELTGTPIQYGAESAIIDEEPDVDAPIVEQVWRIDKFTMHMDQKKGKSYRELRDSALYVEFGEEYRPISPDEQVSQETVESMIESAFRTRRYILEMDALAEGIGARGHFK